MSQFLFIIPDGWTKLDWATLTSMEGVNLSHPAVTSYISGGDINGLSDQLKLAGAIPEDAYLNEAKLFNDEVLIVRLG